MARESILTSQMHALDDSTHQVCLHYLLNNSSGVHGGALHALPSFRQ